MIIGIDASRATRVPRTGTENYSLHVTRALLALDDENAYRLYCNSAPPAGLFGAAKGATVRALPAPYLWTHGRLNWELRWNPPHVLFVPAHVVPVGCPCPAVVTVHDLGYLHYPQAHAWAARWYLRLGTWYSVRAARKVIAVSAATKADLMARLGVPAEKIVVVPESCPPEFAKPVDPEVGRAVARRYGLAEPYIVFVGTQHPRKNLVRLVEAFARARPRLRTPHRLALIGRPGWRAEEVRGAIRRLGLEQAVLQLGYVDEADLPPLLGAAAALAFPSLYEGFGLPVLEAMASGVPVIASSASSLPEVVGDAGLLVDPHDVDGMAEAMVRLLTDSQLHADLSRRGLERARSFSWERTGRATLRVLREAALS